MRRVLVTGASGFIGRNTIPLLREADFEVHAISRDPPSPNSVEWHCADLLDPDVPARLVREVGPTHLLHLAWFAEPHLYWNSLENARWVEASLRLLGAFARSDRRLVVAGTCAEYDWSYGFCSEGVTPLCPESLYGTCKHALQIMLRKLASEARMSTAWGRIFYVYGPGEHPQRLVPSVIRSLLNGEPAPCTTGTQIRDFLHVADVGSAFVRLLESDVEGPVNVASGRPLAVRQLLMAIGDAIGASDLLQFGEVQKRSTEPPLLVADVRRITEEVGWKSRYSLHEGVKDTVAWWRRHPNGTHELTSRSPAS